MNKHITIMFNGTIWDMLGEYLYFLKEIFPELKDFCGKHGIDLEYIDSSYEMPIEDVLHQRALLDYLEFIDMDRTFFVCFRGQRYGWIPTAGDVDGLTLDIYPELVKYVTSISITDIAMLHALRPFCKIEDGEEIRMDPVKHAFFYYRNADYVKDLNHCQKLIYTNLSMGDDEDVGDINLAKAKDIVFEIKREFAKIEGCESEVIVRHYDGIWDNDLEIADVLREYTTEYAKLRGQSPKDLMRLYEHEDCKGTKGCFVDFKFEDKSVKDIVIDDFKKALVAEFPEYFK